MEIKLTNTARASLEERLDDYHDFIRARKLSLWGKDSREAKFVRNLGANPEVAYAQYREFCETRPPEVVANIAICLIHQTNYLLDQQMRRLERDFIKDGGFRERMRRARPEQRCQNAKHSPRSSKKRQT
jgi:four helix bundle suffix protein